MTGKPSTIVGWSTALLASAAVLAGMVAVPAAADAEDSFYKGKSINFVVRSGPGGGNDFYARLIARHLGRHIPGEPDVRVTNMPGGGGIRSFNYLSTAAPKDGTLVVKPSLAYVWLGIAQHTAPFDAIVMVLDGRLMLTIGGVEVPALPGTIVRMPAGAPDAPSPLGDQPMPVQDVMDRRARGQQRGQRVNAHGRADPRRMERLRRAHARRGDAHGGADRRALG